MARIRVEIALQSTPTVEIPETADFSA